MAQGLDMKMEEMCFQPLFKTRGIDGQEVYHIGVDHHSKLQKVLDPPSNLRPYYSRLDWSQSNPVLTFFQGMLHRVELPRVLTRLLNAQTLIMDVGCGSGHFIRMFDQRGYKAAAVDAGDQRPESLKGCQGIPYYQIDYETYEIKGFLPSGPVCMILRHVLEHLRQPGCFLKKMKIMGVQDCYIVVPNTACWETRVFGQYSWNYDVPRHLWFFDGGSLRALLKEAGFEVIASGYDTVPSVFSAAYRFLKLQDASPKICSLLRPRSFLNMLGFPLNLFLPFNVLWVYARALDT